jgi:hypothetical protein
MIIVGFGGIHRQTTIVWKDGLKELGQRKLDEVVDEIRMEGKENGE